MRPVIVTRLLGALGVWWIVYTAWPVSLMLGLVAVGIWIAVAVARSSRRGRQAAARAQTMPRKSAAKAVGPEPTQRITTMSDTQSASIVAAAEQLPPAIAKRSGSLFYSGPSAFRDHRPLYILGLNPGGSAIEQAAETVEADLEQWKAVARPWSSYLDDSWQSKPPGTHGMQPRMRHMFDQLGLDLREVPASNVVFVRSANEAALAAEKASLLPQCWPVHEAVIRDLGVRVILCLGGTAGRWVRDALGAHQLLDRFSERNARRWTSEAHIAPGGRAVVTVTHPGRADWRNSAADPTPLVRAVLDRA